jgi:purine-binding chemotaxis protein CheW
MSESRYLTFRSGTQRLALHAGEVTEIVRPPRVTRLPHAPDALRGVANLRGTVLPIVALDRLMGGDAGVETPASRVLVLNRAAPLGLLVDEVSRLAEGKPQTGVLDVDAVLSKGFAIAPRTRSAMRATGAGQAQAAAPAEEGVTLIAFRAAGQTYALGLAHAQQVIPLPPDHAISAGGGPVSLGVTSWRDTLMPLISLRAVLGQPKLAEARRTQVVVVRTERGIIGLVTDGLCEILRVPSSLIDTVPAALARSHGRTEIEAIVRLNGGKRLVSILSAETFFAAQYLGDQSWGAASEQDDQAMVNAEQAGTAYEQVVVFTLGDERYGLPIAAVDEIVRMPDSLTRLPRAPDFVEGVINLRGKVLPVIDQARRFGAPTKVGARRVLVVSLDGVQVGFAVDTVREIMNVPVTDLSAVPDITGEGSQVFDRAVRRSDGETVILTVDPRELLSRTERDLVASLRVQASEAS